MNPRPNETCTCASACVVKLPRLCAVRLWDLWLSSHLCQWCMERSAPGTAPVTWTDIHWDVTYRCCVTTSVGQSWGSGGGGCWTAQVWRSVCVCMCVCEIFIKNHPGNAVSLIYDRGKALVAATFPGSRLRWESHMCAVVRARPSHMCL